MKYITGIFALNLSCKLDTCGDWHCFGLNWNNVKIEESESSFFGDYGIEKNKYVLPLDGMYSVANHIRALLDMLYFGQYGSAEGMNKDFIDNDAYTEEIFDKIKEMYVLPNWNDIDDFMESEYYDKWLSYKDHYDLKPKETVLSLENRKIVEEFKTYGFRIWNIRELESFLLSKERYLKNKCPDNLADTNTKFEMVLSTLKQALAYNGIDLDTYNHFKEAYWENLW